MLHPGTVHVADDSPMALHLGRSIESFDNTDVVLVYQGRNQLIGGAAMSIDPTWSSDGVTLMMEGLRSTPSTGIKEYLSVDCERSDVYKSHWRIDGSPQPNVDFTPIGGQFTGLAHNPLIGLTGETGGAIITISPGRRPILGSHMTQEMSISMVGESLGVAGVTISPDGFFAQSPDLTQEMIISVVGEALGAAGVIISTGGFFALGANSIQEMGISDADLAVWPSGGEEQVDFWVHENRYLTPLTPVAARIGELILEEQGHEDLLLDRQQQAEWLKRIMAFYWGTHSPQPFIGFDLDDGLFILSWQSDNECNTLTIDAKERKGWYDPWPVSEYDNPVPGEIDLETEEAWDRLRSALTTTRS